MTSAFTENGLKPTIAGLVDEVRELYLADQIPWVVGYSGGKDSTATLMLVWMALREMSADHHHKPVYVISTDTLVENPVVASWVDGSLDLMRRAATAQNLPIDPHKLTPAIQDTFWVNLIGRGYPSPRHKFRWCTERMKIRPSNTFIRNVVRDNGEAIVVLGTRKAESAKRAASMDRHERYRIRDRLSPNGNLPNSLVFSPIEDWTNDDVWQFLTSIENPWGYDNKDLLAMYAGATEDGECPLVVDDTTPSCGDSRFGCWTCTMVEQDKSMAAMIRNDDEKEWMLPLLDLRNQLDDANDKHLRDYRRMNGTVQLIRGEAIIHGPYTQEARADWLRKLLDVQTFLQAEGPEHVRSIQLIQPEELQEIRRIWVVDKHEIEDLLPGIYEEVTGNTYPGPPLDDAPVFGHEEMELLRSACRAEGEDDLYPLARELLDIEWRMRTKVRRSGLFGELESSLRRNFYDDKDDAADRKRREFQARLAAANGDYKPNAQLMLVSIDEPRQTP